MAASGWNEEKPGYIVSPYAGVDGDIEPYRFTFTDCDRFWQFLAPVNSLISDINDISSGFEDRRNSRCTGREPLQQ